VCSQFLLPENVPFKKSLTKHQLKFQGGVLI